MWRAWVVSAGRMHQQIPILSQQQGSDRQPAIYVDADAHYWISYAQQMAEEQTARIRHTRLDNAPSGRDVHWSSPPAWWLLGCGRLVSRATRLDLIPAIARAGYWSSLALLALSWIGFGGFLGRQTGWKSAAFFFVSYPASLHVLRQFGIANPDHGAWHLVALTGLMVGVAADGAGSGSPPSPTSASTSLRPLHRIFRHHFGLVFSAFWGAFGLWIGATIQFLPIVLLQAGALIMACVFRRHWSPDEQRHWAEGWRLWSRLGAALSVVFYLIEYAPGHMGMHLEVLHPLYALAWWSLGEFSYALSVPAPVRPAGRILRWALPLIGFLLLPAAIGWGPPEWHAMKWPFMRHLHGEIAEFKSYISVYGAQWFPAFFKQVSFHPLILAGALVAGLSKSYAPAERARIGVLGLAGAALLGIAFLQNRWTGMAVITCTAVAAALLAGPAAPPSSSPLRRTSLPIAACLLTALLSIAIWQNLSRILHQFPRDAAPHELQLGVAAKETAVRLSETAARRNQPCIIMADPFFLNSLPNFGQTPLVGSLYWENAHGLRDTLLFFSSRTDERAKQILEQRGITHVIVGGAPLFAQTMGFDPETDRPVPDLQSTLAWRLSARVPTPPSWLRPVNMSVFGYHRRFDIRIYEVIRPAPVAPPAL
ncbi:MAG: hypothetical protein GX548_06190 [Lentisphaerae bacterium]|nr:hypothetical protein [Lentisphaerota bacterium]